MNELMTERTNERMSERKQRKRKEEWKERTAQCKAGKLCGCKERNKKFICLIQKFLEMLNEWTHSVDGKLKESLIRCAYVSFERATRWIRHNTTYYGRVDFIHSHCAMCSSLFYLTIYDFQRRSHRTQTHLSVNYPMEQTVNWWPLSLNSMQFALAHYQLAFSTLSPSISPYLSHARILISFRSFAK